MNITRRYPACARFIQSLAVICLLACWHGLAAAPIPPAVVFKDETAALGLSNIGSSACWVDFDNDGWVDLVSEGTLWKNNAGKGFTKFASIGTPAVAADFDNDGFVDFYCFAGKRLYHNNAGKSFDDVPLPTLPASICLGCALGDFNGDGYIDIFMGGYYNETTDGGYPSLLLLSHQGKTFELAWSDNRYHARGVTACDFDRNGTLDVYVSNYHLQPNVLWHNDGKGHLTDVTAAYNAIATSPGFDGGHSIGAAWGDFDNDGYIDLFAGNFAHRDDRGDQPKSRFLRNRGPKGNYAFEDLGPCGVFYQESYASPAAGDYDNDGNLDLFFTTVYGIASFDKKNNPVLYHNEGKFAFTDATATANLAGLGATYEAAWADFNNDGCLDLVTDGKLFINQGNANHWLEVRLAGDGKLVNASAIGAQVRVKLKDKTLTRQVEAGTGQGNQNDLTLHFGLGGQKSPVTLEILWPNGTVQTLRRVKTNRVIAVRFKTAKR